MAFPTMTFKLARFFYTSYFMQAQKNNHEKEAVFPCYV